MIAIFIYVNNTKLITADQEAPQIFLPRSLNPVPEFAPLQEIKSPERRMVKAVPGTRFISPGFGW